MISLEISDERPSKLIVTSQTHSPNTEIVYHSISYQHTEGPFQILYLTTVRTSEPIRIGLSRRSKLDSETFPEEPNSNDQNPNNWFNEFNFYW